MSKEIETEDGQKEVVYTADEYKAVEEKAAQVETLSKELDEAKRVNAERGENFTAYSKMSEEQKKAYDANTTNLLKREEAMATELESLKNEREADKKKQTDSAKTNALSNLHHGNEEVKKTLEEKYALLAMPETTPEEITARAHEAAKLAGIQIDSRNPLYTPVNGEAPSYKEKKEYADTPEGKEAVTLVRGALGIKEAK